MKKITLLLLLLCAIPVAALRVGGRQTPGDKAASGIAFLLPKADADFSDLDVRDAQNRAIQSPSAVHELADLFRENLVNLVVFAGAHATRETAAWLDSISGLINKSILLRLSIIFELLQDAFLPSSRRFVHNVHNLWTTFPVGISTECLLLSTFSLSRSPRKVNLRC